jgi:DNA-binding beta-propeller fold protein YncE
LKHFLLALSLSLLPLQALATTLPDGVIQTLRAMDPRVKIRFDGLVTFEQGDRYLPVLPADSTQPATRLTLKQPQNAQYPDILGFDNQLFLLRLVPDGAGRFTLPKRADYPIALKEGLLPQDLVIPTNLFIPPELKVILGALPYAPGVAVYSAPAPTDLPSEKTYFLADRASQSLWPLSGKSDPVALGCMPARVLPMPDQLMVSCLNANEVAVIDPVARLVKTRIPVGNRPDDLLYVKETGDVLVGNRFSNFLTLIPKRYNGDDVPTAQIPLPGPGGAMAYDPASPFIYVADAAAGVVYEVNWHTRKAVRQFKTPHSIAAVWVNAVSPAEETQEGPNLRLWVLSRAQDTLLAVDVTSGKELFTLKTGHKPVAMAAKDTTLYVVCAGDNRIDVIDTVQGRVTGSIALEPDLFPTAIEIEGNTALVACAGSPVVLKVNLSGGFVAESLPVNARSVALAAYPPENTAPTEEGLAMFAVRTMVIDSEPRKGWFSRLFSKTATPTPLSDQRLPEIAP